MKYYIHTDPIRTKFKIYIIFRPNSDAPYYIVYYEYQFRLNLYQNDFN